MRPGERGGREELGPPVERVIDNSPAERDYQDRVANTDFFQ